MTAPNLSYIITTRNKLPYLRRAMTRLLAEHQDNENILVADGASADGTKEFLAELYRAGKIQNYTSEPDEGESHALNKLLLRAQGQLIKIITDDDVFFYPAIRACKTFLLAHPEIDLIGTEGGISHNQNPHDIARAVVYETAYRAWRTDHTPFSFCGLGIMFQRSSLPILGLWDPAFRRADAEFSYRITAGKANIAWYTGYSFVNVSNPQSVSIVHMKKIKEETERLDKFYLNKDPDSYFAAGCNAIRVKLNLTRGSSSRAQASPAQFLAASPDLFLAAEKWLEARNQEQRPEFLINDRHAF